MKITAAGDCAMQKNLPKYYEGFQQIKDYLMQGDVRFFCAEDGRVGFTRSYAGRKLTVYLNNGATPWDIPAGKVLMDRGTHTAAPNWFTVEPMGYCILEAYHG